METGSTPEPRMVAGKSVVVTGGTTGIGLATARLLAARGARLLIFGRHEKELREALDGITSVGEVYGLTADVSTNEDVRRVFREADEKLGGVDILVNNAALSADSILDSEYEEWQYVINTNLLGYMACCREAVERMRRRGEGHIVNIGSMSADLREEESNVYVATKAAVQGFTEALRKAVNKEGIKVTLVEPGKVASDMSGPKEEQPEKERRLEMLKAEDIAECVYFCLAQPRRCDVVAMQIRPLMQII
jgi:NADP-dependent 3-hydroxy acid dehydrogenase YdfG